MIILGRVSTETRGLPIVVGFAETPDLQVPGNRYPIK